MTTDQMRVSGQPGDVEVASRFQFCSDGVRVRHIATRIRERPWSTFSTG
jgi:hypothetical protein